MRIFAFHGSRYSGRVADPGALAAPPFDQIDEAERRRLHGLDALHFAHLTRPAGEGGEEPAPHAASLYERWRREGILERDREPSLYLHEIRLPEGGRRLGLCALVGLEEPSSGLILPHESTVSRTVEERLELLRSLRADLEPILLLCDDAGELEALLLQDAEREAPLAEHRDPYGNVHLFHRLRDGARIARYRQLLADLPALIADGHHRYEVARRFAAEVAAPPGSAAAAKLAVITSLASPGLAIDPIHRALPAGGDLERLAAAAVARRRAAGADGAGLAAEVAAEPQPALAVMAPGGEPEIWKLDPETGPPGLPAAARELSVVLLHHDLLPRAGFDASAAHDGRIHYRSDPDQLFESVSREEASFGFWLPPIRPDRFAAAVPGGELLPPKWTRFLPKLVSGLVWAEHDTELL